MFVLNPDSEDEVVNTIVVFRVGDSGMIQEHNLGCNSEEVKCEKTVNC